MFNFNPSFLNRFSGGMPNQNPNAAFNRFQHPQMNRMSPNSDNNPDMQRLQNMRPPSMPPNSMGGMPMNQMMGGALQAGFLQRNPSFANTMMPQQGTLAALLRRQFPNFRT